MLTIFLDEHGVQLSMLQKVLCRLNLRIVWFRDPFHRYWRDTLLALQDAGLWSDILERMHVMNIPFGPWKSAKWWRDMKDALAQHFDKYDHTNPFFSSDVAPVERGGQPERIRKFSAGRQRRVPASRLELLAASQGLEPKGLQSEDEDVVRSDKTNGRTPQIILCPSPGAFQNFGGHADFRC